MSGIAKTFPLIKTLSGKAGTMELASNELWEALRKLSVHQLKLIQPTAEYKPLIDSLIVIRELMGDGQYCIR